MEGGWLKVSKRYGKEQLLNTPKGTEKFKVVALKVRLTVSSA